MKYAVDVALCIVLLLIIRRGPQGGQEKIYKRDGMARTTVAGLDTGAAGAVGLAHFIMKTDKKGKKGRL